MWSGVDEVAEGDEGGGEADGGAVKGSDEDFGVRVEGVCDEEVVGDEGLEHFAADIGRWGECSGDSHVGTAVIEVLASEANKTCRS